jgi:hypothetical protein
MSFEEDLAKKVELYQNLGKENPNIDVNLLMSQALMNQKQNLVSSRMKYWAYTISIGVPPFGLLFAFKLFWSSEDDAKQAALTCVILTVVSLFFYWLLGKMIFSSTGANLQQIEQIKPSDIQQLVQ